MQPEQRAELNTILERHGGDFELVARALMTTPQLLRERLANDPWLKARWIDRSLSIHDRPPVDLPLDVVDDFDPKPAALSPTQQAFVDGIDQQGGKLRRLDWAAIGVTNPQQQQLLQAYESFVGVNILATLNLTHGGMVGSFAQVTAMELNISDKLKTVPTESEIGQVLFEQLARCWELKIKLNAEANKAGHLRVMMESKAREGEAKRRTRKPGFGKPRNVTATGSAPAAQPGVGATVETFVP